MAGVVKGALELGKKAVAPVGALSAALLPSEDAEASFIGQLAKTFSKSALEKAQEMEKLGFSRDAIWKETGAMGSPTFKDVDGHWKQEIDDSGFQPKPLWDEANPNYSTSGDPAMWSDWRDESAARQKGVPIGNGFELGALADAYPQLQTTRIKGSGESAFGGSYNPQDNLITLPSNDALMGLDESLWKRYEADDVVRATPAHELQHAIQHKEGFAKGGSPSASQFILERAHNEAVEPYRAGWAAHSRLSGELGDLYKADYITKLDELSRKEGIKPSQITNMSDYYQYSDVLRDKFGVPPTKAGPARDAWYQSAAAFFKKRALDNVSWAQRDLAEDFTGNRKELQSRIRKLERQRGKYQDDAREHSALDRKFKQSKQQSDREVYQHLAGEAEARNVEKRLNMSMDERINTPPWQTLDVDENKLIVHGKKLAKPALTAAALAAGNATAADLVQSTGYTPEPALLAALEGNAQPGRSLAGSLANTSTELAAAINRGVTSGVDFLTVDQVNALAELLGSDWRAPTLTGALAPATTGNHMEPGLHRDATRALGELLSPI